MLSILKLHTIAIQINTIKHFIDMHESLIKVFIIVLNGIYQFYLPIIVQIKKIKEIGSTIIYNDLF